MLLLLLLLVVRILVHLDSVRDRFDDVVALRVQDVVLAAGPVGRVRRRGKRLVVGSVAEHVGVAGAEYAGLALAVARSVGVALIARLLGAVVLGLLDEHGSEER